MSKFEQQLQKAFKDASNGVSLRADNKALMREHLQSYMSLKPLRQGAQHGGHVRSRTAFFPFFSAHHFAGAFMIAALVLTSTFGVSRAADDALPGDLLYPVKVDINEEIHRAFLSSEGERIAFERERAERRLMEASQLALQGELDDERQQEVSRRFAEHTSEVVSRVRAVEEEDPVLAAEASGDFETALDAHEAVLARLIVEREDGKSNADGRELVEQVRTAAMEAEKVRVTAEEKLGADDSVAVAIDTEVVGILGADDPEQEDIRDGSASANMRVRAAYSAQERAEARLAEVEAELAKVAEAQTDLATQANAQLEEGRKLMEEGRAALEASEYGTAYNTYKRAGTVFQKVLQLLRVASLFDIDIYPEASSALPEKEQTDTAKPGSSLDELHTEAEQAIAQARELLLSWEGFSEDEARDANSLVKDARAQVLRAEIARVLNDTEGATSFYEKALVLSGRAKALVERALPEGFEPAPRTDDESHSRGGSIAPEIDIPAVVTPPEPPELPALDLVTVYHEYADGVHTYSGVFYTPTPCFTLDAQARVAESYPEQVTLVLTTDEGQGACAMMIDRKAFKVEVQASPEAIFAGLLLNGEESRYTLVEGPNEVLFEEPANIPMLRTAPDPPVSGTATDSGLESEYGLFERALRATGEFDLSFLRGR